MTTAAEIVSGRMSAIQKDVISDNKVVSVIIVTNPCFVDLIFGDPVAVRSWNTVLMAPSVNSTGQQIQQII